MGVEVAKWESHESFSDLRHGKKEKRKKKGEIGGREREKGGSSLIDGQIRLKKRAKVC